MQNSVVNQLIDKICQMQTQIDELKREADKRNDFIEYLSNRIVELDKALEKTPAPPNAQSYHYPRQLDPL